VLELKRRLNEIMARHTGQKVEKIQQDLERDNFMGASKLSNMGLLTQFWKAVPKCLHRKRMNPSKISSLCAVVGTYGSGTLRAK